MADGDETGDDGTECKGTPTYISYKICRFKEEFQKCGYNPFSLQLWFHVKKNNQEVFKR